MLIRKECSYTNYVPSRAEFHQVKLGFFIFNDIRTDIEVFSQHHDGILQNTHPYQALGKVAKWKKPVQDRYDELQERIRREYSDVRPSF